MEGRRWLQEMSRLRCEVAVMRPFQTNVDIQIEDSIRRPKIFKVAVRKPVAGTAEHEAAFEKVAALFGVPFNGIRNTALAVKGELTLQFWYHLLLQ